MPDIFISYSRRNKAFVQNLERALRSQRKDVWVDWEDIPPTVDFVQEIYQGIDSSDAFVAVLSPDYLASKYCLMELERAAALNKRLLPVVCLDVNPEEVPEALRSLNWIFARESDNFEESLKTLVSAYDTDFDYLRAHTRYTLRALEWDAEGEDSSFLLKGKELVEAENWLAHGLEHTPQPTSLQADYINTSRVVENRRQRTLLAGVTVALIVSVALAFLSFMLYGQSEERRILADSNAATATSAQGQAEENAATAVAAEAAAVREAALARALNLASSAQLAAINGNSDLALILALEANQPDAPPAQAQRVLMDLAYAPGTRRVLAGHRDAVYRVAYTLDGSRLIATSTGEITIWNPATGQMLRRWAAHHDAPINALALTPDGEHFVTGGDDGQIIVWEIESGAQVRAFPGHDAPVSDLDLNRDGTILLSASLDHTVRRWDFGSGALRDQLEADGGGVWALDISPDDTLFATAGDDGVIRIWQAETAELLRELRHHTDVVWDIAFVTDNSGLVSASDDRTVVVWTVETGEPLVILDDALLSVWTVAMHPDAQRIIAGSVDTNIYIWDGILQRLIDRLGGHTSVINRLAISPDGQQVASASGDRTVRIWDINNGLQTALIPARTGANVSIQFDQAGERFMVASLVDADLPAIIVQEYAAGQPGPVLQTFGDAESSGYVAALSPDGRQVLTASANAELILWDADSGQEIYRREGHTGPLSAITFSADGQRAASGDTNGVMLLWDVESGEILHEWNLGSRLNAIRFTPDDQGIVVGDIFGEIRVYDLESGSLIREYPLLHAGAIYALDYTADGSRLLSSSTDSTLILWDAAAAAMLYQMHGHRAPVLTVDISADDRLALSGGSDSMVILWDLKTGTEVRRFIGHSGDVWGVRFAPDGAYAASTSIDGTTRFWRVEQPLDEVLAWIRSNRHLRAFSCAERAFYQIEPLCAEATPEPTP